MKALLSFALGVSMCCLLPSHGMAADAARPAKDAAVKAMAVSGFALTTFTRRMERFSGVSAFSSSPQQPRGALPSSL